MNYPVLPCYQVLLNCSGRFFGVALCDRLTCYLEGLVIKSVTRKKKGECDKFRLYVKGDRLYILEAGWSWELKIAG
jgi:hypothetical protein